MKMTMTKNISCSCRKMTTSLEVNQNFFKLIQGSRAMWRLNTAKCDQALHIDILVRRK